jgi:hypothetical protein
MPASAANGDGQPTQAELRMNHGKQTNSAWVGDDASRAKGLIGILLQHGTSVWCMGCVSCQGADRDPSAARNFGLVYGSLDERALSQLDAFRTRQGVTEVLGLVPGRRQHRLMFCTTRALCRPSRRRGNTPALRYLAVARMVPRAELDLFSGDRQRNR